MTNASTDEYLLLNEIFFPTAIKDWNKLYNGQNLYFVHYTSVEAFSSILEHEQIWLRDVRAMNDTQEVQYGYSMIKEIIQQDTIKKKMFEAFNTYDDDIAKISQDSINFFLKQGFESFLTEVFVTCLSIHQSPEDDHGRLSMWRGYNKGSTGVALIINRNIMNEESVLPVALSGVDYIHKDTTEKKIIEIIDRIRDDRLALSKIHQQMLYAGQKLGIWEYLMEALIYASVCIKHPGFKEEKEWRIIYMPRLRRRQMNLEEYKYHRCINGTVQKIYAIPLDKETAKKTGISLDSIIDRIIIGPCKFPDVTREGIISMMEEKGICDAENRVAISGIPLRPE